MRKQVAAADAVLREAISVDEPDAPGWLMWLAVRVGGSGSWDAPGPEPPEVAAQLQAA
jgi:hypothetical protein